MSELINGRTPEEIKRGLSCKMAGQHCNFCSYQIDCISEDGDPGVINRDALALIERLESERDAALAKVPKWIGVKDHKPAPFVSVQVFMTDAGSFPPVREGYLIDDTHFYIPAIRGIHPVSHWTELATPPKGDA